MNYLNHKENSMKILRNILLTTILSFTAFTYSDVAEVYQWKAFPGKSAEMMESMERAAEIHRKQGAHVSIDAHNVGSTQLVNYVLRWDDGASYAATKDAQTNSEEWVEFWAESSANPSGEMMASFQGANIDQSVMASDFDGSYVYSVAVWEVQPGKALELIQRFQTAEKILEDAGARVEIYQGGWGSVNEFHYVLMYENWAALNESFTKMGPGSDWAEYMASSAQQEIISTQTAFFTAQTLGQ
jgi:hypothetical protein